MQQVPYYSCWSFRRAGGGASLPCAGGFASAPARQLHACMVPSVERSENLAEKGGTCLELQPGACGPKEQAWSQRLPVAAALQAAAAAAAAGAHSPAPVGHRPARPPAAAAAGAASAQRAAVPPWEAGPPAWPWASCASPAMHQMKSAMMM